MKLKTGHVLWRDSSLFCFLDTFPATLQVLVPLSGTVGGNPAGNARPEVTKGTPGATKVAKFVRNRRKTRDTLIPRF